MNGQGCIMSTSDCSERDKEWARRIQDGDSAAFRLLFQSYAEPLCTFTEQYTKSPEIAEELVQDLFFKIWKDRSTWAPTVSVKSYLYTSARNLALDYLKHQRVVDDWKQEALADNESIVPTPDQSVCTKRLRRAVQEAIDELPERRRQVFKLSRQHGLTYKEIATVLDISIKTVETHMRRAFKFLRQRLAPHRLSSSDD